MTDDREKRRRKKLEKGPVDVVNGIADRSPKDAAWRHIVLLLIFAAWIAILVFMNIAGSAGK